MSRFSFVHAADLHLDTPFTGVGRVPAPIAAVLRDASLEAWDALVELALARQAAFVVLAGGLYDGPVHGVRAPARLRAGFERLAARRVAAFVVGGDADRIETLSTAWPSTVTVFGAAPHASAPLPLAAGASVTVYGASRPSRGWEQSPAASFRQSGGGGFHVGVLHARVGEQSTTGTAPTCSVTDLRAAGMDYWALGGRHQRTVLNAGDPWIVYPGTVQGRAPVEAERGPHGAVVVEVDGAEVRRVSFEELDRVRCLDLEAEEEAEPQALCRTLGERARQLRDEHPRRTLLVEIGLPSAGALRRKFARPAEREALLHALRRDAEEWSPALWWVGFRNPDPQPAGSPPGELARRVLERSGALLDGDAALAAFLDRRLEPLHRSWAADLEPPAGRALVGRAAELALHVLDDEDRA